MKIMMKMTCAVAVALLLLPVPGQAARTASANRGGKPVVTMGDRPGAIVPGAGQNKNDTKNNKAAKGSNTEIKNKKDSGTQVSQGNKTDTKREVKTKSRRPS